MAESRAQLIIGALLVITAWLYAPLLESGYVYEDANWQEAMTAPLTWMPPTRALSMWTYRQTPDPRRAHAANIGVHLVNGMLVGAIALELFALPVAAVWAAGLFLLHPFASEAVSYTAARTDLLWAFGTLLAVWSLLRALRGSPWWLALCALGCLCAGQSKEIGLVTVPLVVLTAWRWAPDHPVTQLVKSWGLPVLGFLGGLSWWHLSDWLHMAAGGGGSSLTWAHFVGLQLAMIWRWLALVPVPIGFTIDRDALLATVALQGMAWMLTATAALLIVLGWTRWPVLAWALLWTAISVAPRLLIPQQDFLALHHLYVAWIAISLSLGVSLSRIAWSVRVDAPCLEGGM